MSKPQLSTDAMKQTRLLPMLSLLAVGSCAPEPGPPLPSPVMRWAAELDARPQFGEVAGEVSAVQVEGGTTAQLRLENASPGAVHPWHVHVGSCASGGGIAGDAASYPPVEVDENGSGSATALIDIELDASDPYHVNVHLASDQMATIVACGDLRIGTLD